MNTIVIVDCLLSSRKSCLLNARGSKDLTFASIREQSVRRVDCIMLKIAVTIQEHPTQSLSPCLTVKGVQKVHFQAGGGSL